MAAPEDKPEIAKLRGDIEIPTALIQNVSHAQKTPMMTFVCVRAIQAYCFIGTFTQTFRK